jgi:pimeloyl-CoA dehydrogenase
MDFSLTEDHIALQDAVRRFCDGEYPAHQRGNPEDPQLARRRWTAMAELGLLGLPLDPELGGSGQSAVELMLVAQELGRALAGGAWISSTVLAAQLLDRAGTPEQRSHWLPQLAGGSKRIAIALDETGSRYAPTQIASQATSTSSGWRIDGRKSLVLDGDAADAFIVVVRTGGRAGDAAGLSMFVVDAATPGVTVNGYATLDGRRAAQVVFEGVLAPDAALVGPAGGALPIIELAGDAAMAALCAEAAGALEALLDLTAEHLKTRKQFGSPLAKFQVLQHRVADMLIALEQTKSMACAAAMAVDSGDAATRRRLVSAAKVIAGQAGRQVGQWAIQLHGAMGMTDECRIGHYVKRLMVINQLFGDAAHHLRVYAGSVRSNPTATGTA